MLSEGEVHVWRFDLNVSDFVLRRFRETLCEDELARADRFRFCHLRRRFVVGRGVLRTILADYLSIEPQRVLVFLQLSRETFTDSSALQYRVQCLALS